MKRMIAAIGAAAVLVLSGGAAHAGPSPQQPAAVKIDSGQAHRVAAYAVHRYLYAPLSGPHRHDAVGQCSGGPRTWRCPAVVSNDSIHCSLSVWVWADAPGSYYYEWHDLQCD